MERNNIRPVLRLQFEVTNTAEERKAEQVFELFVTVTVLENFEAFDCAVDMFDKNTILRQISVKLLLQNCQFAIAWFLKRRQAEFV